MCHVCVGQRVFDGSVWRDYFVGFLFEAHFYTFVDSPTSTIAQRGLISFIFEFLTYWEFRICLSAGVDLLEILWHVKVLLEASGLTLVDVAFAIRRAERDISDYCKRGSVLANSLAEATSDAVKGQCGPSYVERLLYTMHQTGTFCILNSSALTKMAQTLTVVGISTWKSSRTK